LLLSPPFKTGARRLAHTAADLKEPTMPRTHVLAAAFAAVLIATATPIAARPLATAGEVATATHRPSPHALHCGTAGATAFARIELFFGLSRPGGVVSEEEFKAFVDGAVTPRFPDGLTLLSGTGQFRESGGTVIVEGTKLLILLVPLRQRDTEARIEQIRSEYKRQFQQQSVLRVDAVACVSF
jgi:hypothetical protein